MQTANALPEAGTPVRWLQMCCPQPSIPFAAAEYRAPVPRGLLQGRTALLRRRCWRHSHQPPVTTTSTPVPTAGKKTSRTLLGTRQPGRHIALSVRRDRVVLNVSCTHRPGWSDTTLKNVLEEGAVEWVVSLNGHACRDTRGAAVKRCQQANSAATRCIDGQASRHMPSRPATSLTMAS